MEIKVTDITEPKVVAKGKNSWNEVTVTYTGKQGSKSKTLRSFVDKEAYVFFTSDGVKAGDTVEVDMKKEGDYWNWKGAKVVNGAEQSASSNTGQRESTGAGKRGDWETSEERAAKQRYIVRQSSIDYSLKFWDLQLRYPRTTATGVMSTAPTITQILKTASIFEGNVFEGKIEPPAREAVEVEEPVKKTVGKALKVVKTEIEEDDIPV